MDARRAWFVGPLVLLAVAGCLDLHKAVPAATGAVEDLARAAVCQGRIAGLDLQHVSGLDLERALAARTLSSVDLVDAYLARIAAFDREGPKVNSVRDLNVNARAEAQRLDAERAAGHVRGPLHGLPILLKDNIGTMDEPTTAGSIALEKNVPPKDATLTAKLRAAGVIILGKTNLSEFANWVSLTMPSGYSTLGGQVVNAYTGGDPSGSSSGSGVAGSMAFSAFAIGTETSGSILSPSNANSLVGVKPTLGLVSRAGIIPLAANFDTPGPMVRTVADAALVLGAIAGPDAADPATAASGQHLPIANDYTTGLRADALRGVRLGYEASTNQLFAQAMADLQAAGAILVPIDSRNLDTVSLSELAVIPNEFKFGLNDYIAHQAGPGLPVKDLTDIILFNQQHPDKLKYGQDLLIASDANPGAGPLATGGGIPIVAASRAVADNMFAQDRLDAVIGPNAPFTGLGAAAGYPTVVVPSGYNGPTPQGLSFFGPAWSEARLLSYAYAYEQGSMRRVEPTMVTPSLMAGVCA